MGIKLLFEAFIKYILGLIITGLLLFLPAGTINYINAWLLIGVLFIPMLILGIVLWIKDKELLRKRLNSKEKENKQKGIIIISLIIFVLGFIIAGLDFKFKWTYISFKISIIASVIIFISYILFIEIMKENTYLSRTVEVQENQKVIDTGMYTIVRHPMYFSVTLMYLSFPIVLGSLISFIIFLPFPFLLVKRIDNEEEILKSGLNGYEEYMKKVKYRMIPFIW